MGPEEIEEAAPVEVEEKGEVAEPLAEDLVIEEAISAEIEAEVAEAVVEPEEVISTVSVRRSHRDNTWQADELE